MKTPAIRSLRSDGGFTLVEMCVSMGIVTLVSVAMFNVFWQIGKTYNETTLMSITAKQASLGLERMVVGVGTNAGIREAQASTVTLTSTSTNWVLSFNTGLTFTYNANTQKIVDQSGKCIVTNVISSTATNTTSGCQLSVSVAQSCGGRTVTNTMTTFAEYRN